MPTYQQRLTTNNLKIDEITAMARNLPDEGDTKPYIELEYIQSNGLQYIDTLVKPYSTLFDCEFALTTTSSSTNSFVAGVYNGGNRYYPVAFAYYPIKFNSADKNNNIIALGAADTNKHHIIYNDYDNKVIFDDVEKGTVTDLPSISGDNLYLFALNGVSGTEQYLVGRIYHAKIIDKTTSRLIRNFIPVIRKKDGEVCLYDLTNNMFFTNQGTSGFVAGPVKNVSKLNIFTQLTEPTIKKGIWLQTDKEMEHCTCDDDVVESESWYPDGTFRNIPYQFFDGAAVMIGTDIYLLGGDKSDAIKRYNYKYDTLANAYTRMTDIPYIFRYGIARAIGTDIYLIGGGSFATSYMYKYDTLTDTYTQLTNMPNSILSMYGTASVVGTDIYIFGGTNNSVYKYNTLTDTYTQLASLPYNTATNSNTIGTDIYLFGMATSSSATKNLVYKYDTLTDTYTKLSNIPFTWYTAGSASAPISADIYLFVGALNNTANYKLVYKYNTLTDTYTRLTDMPITYYDGSCVSNDFKIYLLGSRDSYNPTKVRCMQVNTKTYQNNSVVISQGRIYNVGYGTELFTNSIFDIQPLYAFADAWFYTTEDGLITDIPTYYGDGTQWVNIKNPPQNQNS